MKLVWLPETYEAAISITDDPDNGSFIQFKAVYDLLSKLRLPTTRAMWVYKPTEPTGTPPLPISFSAPLLIEKECLDYCKNLYGKGFEICLHGASSGNNPRKNMIEAIQYLERKIGPSRTFICHSKNAENPYWDSKCTDNRFFSRLLQFYSRNQCFGEVEDSPYFWGDICSQKIDYIRLFRTRAVNTLSFNPSMPYHDFNKPYVNFWFSTTKGYLPRLFSHQSVDALCRDHGASLVYQYLHRYADQTGAVHPEVRECLERLSSDRRIFFRPATVLLDRLKLAKLLFLVLYKGRPHLINASRKSVDLVQIKLERGETVDHTPDIGEYYSDRYIIRALPPLSITALPILNPSAASMFRKVTTIGEAVVLRFPLGTVIANGSSGTATIQQERGKYLPADVAGQKLTQGEVKVLYCHPDAERLEILDPITRRELNRLFLGQAMILLREHLLLGRKISTRNYFKNPGKVEDPSNW